MALEPREPGGPVLEPRWLDVDAAAHYLCMSRHALYHRVSRVKFHSSDTVGSFDSTARRWIAG